MGGPALVAFTSEQAHYSYQKVVALTGLGTNNLISVPCDVSGAMSAEGVHIVKSPSLMRVFSPKIYHTVGAQRAQPHACCVLTGAEMGLSIGMPLVSWVAQTCVLEAAHRSRVSANAWAAE